ncbi:MAG TPA: heterodisulfide reductase-related iron-sulfur binding cluster [Bacteroidales bacterium]|nr:heterodisulfide reductase-related iron-sulfur binding cluster [Bacteroidales bacterium]HSA43300.1 heterodisulfide reductase-related iron-sulfur binding cluster [Bacteroidales bacterium]
MKIEGKKRLWQQYQKEIAGDRYFYVRSCVRQNFFPGAEAVFLKIMQDELGKDVYENPAHTSCTGIGYHCDIVPFDTAMTVVARQFSLMAEAGYENFVTSCITSFGLYSEVLETWNHFPEKQEQAARFLHEATGRPFARPSNVSHASDIIYKYRHEIAARAQYRLVNSLTGEPLKGVEHIGCHYAKMFPSKGVGGAEYPYVLVGMIEEWGGEVVDYPERRHCCGFGFRHYAVRANRGYSLSCSRKKFESMQPYKPDFILTNCPGCPMFLDRWQYVISEMEGKTYGPGNEGIPVLTYEELAGLVLGYDPWDIGLQVHQVSVEPLLKKMGIAYDPDGKYLGPGGKYLGRPENPANIYFV